MRFIIRLHKETYDFRKMCDTDTSMNAITTTLAAGLPTEALLAFGVVGIVVLIIGLKCRPKTTVAVLLIAAGSWLYVEHADLINEKFMSLSEAKLSDR